MAQGLLAIFSRFAFVVVKVASMSVTYVQQGAPMMTQGGHSFAMPDMFASPGLTMIAPQQQSVVYAAPPQQSVVYAAPQQVAYAEPTQFAQQYEYAPQQY